jgi:hypothetical protein
MDPEILRQYSKQLQQYTDALLLCGSASPADREEARRKLALLHPFTVFAEDRELIARFGQGDDAARRELARRGGVLHAISVFWHPQYQKAKWEEAQKTLMQAGEPGQVLLVTTLLQRLLSEHYRVEEVTETQNNAPVKKIRDISVHLRYHLVEAGPIALETTIGMTEKMADDVPRTPVFKHEDLTQLLLVLIGFGDQGRPTVRKLSEHPNANVRRTVARAIGEGADAASAPQLQRLVAEAPEWEVRAAAAEACGRLGGARQTLGPVLVGRLGQERDPLVQRRVIRAIGDLMYADGVPDLIRLLDVPSRETAEAAMASLYIITGERFLRKEQWLHWYQAKYPDWRRRQPR